MREKSINKQYQEVIAKCKFISKADEWFIEGTEVTLVDKYGYNQYNIKDRFKNNWSLFKGLTNETFVGYNGELPREDSETCPFTEFLIYDEFNNEISELTLEEYNNILNK